MSGSVFAPYEMGLGSCGTMTQGFSLGSAAEVLDDEACEEGDAVEVGFGFGDGYDEAAVTLEATDFKSVADESTATAAVETDVGEVGSH